MKFSWLKLWYILLVALVIELAGYYFAGLVSNYYRTTMLQQFNDGAKQMQRVDESTPYAAYINQYAQQSGVSPVVAAAVIRAESSFQPQARSSSGAYGLMQIMPATWRYVNKELQVCSERHSGDCTVDCYYNPELNIRIGTAYLGKLNQQFSGNMALALAAYNAGPGAVKRYGGIPPYAETQNYVHRVIADCNGADGKRLRSNIGTAGLWNDICRGLGWLMAVTAAVIGLLIWRLYRTAGCWRWR